MECLYNAIEKKKQGKAQQTKKTIPEGLLDLRNSETDKEIDLEKKASAALSKLIKEPAFTMKGGLLPNRVMCSCTE